MTPLVGCPLPQGASERAHADDFESFYEVTTHFLHLLIKSTFMFGDCRCLVSHTLASAKFPVRDGIVWVV